MKGPGHEKGVDSKTAGKKERVTRLQTRPEQKSPKPCEKRPAHGNSLDDFTWRDLDVDGFCH
jgi:hypothetical protein